MLNWFKSLLNKEDGLSALREQSEGLFTLRRYRESATMALNLIMDREQRLAELALLKENRLAELALLKENNARLLESLRQTKDNHGSIKDRVEELKVKVSGLEYVNATQHKQITEQADRLKVTNTALEKASQKMFLISNIISEDK